MYVCFAFSPCSIFEFFLKLKLLLRSLSFAFGVCIVCLFLNIGSESLLFLFHFLVLFLVLFFPPFLPSFNGSGSASGSASVYVQHFPKYLPLFLPGSHDLRVIVTAAFMIDYRLELYDTHARMRACHKSPSKSPRSRSSVLLHLSYDRWMVDRQCTEHKLV